MGADPAAPQAQADAPDHRGDSQDRGGGSCAGSEPGMRRLSRQAFSFSELLARIQVQLRRGITLGTANCGLQTWFWIRSSARCPARQEHRSLNKEFALLEYLLRNKDEIVTGT